MKTTTGVDTKAAERKLDTQNILVCLGVLSAAIVLVWPVADLAFGDDTAYCHVALVLARTGQFLYNGWETAAMVAHAYWGALFIRLLGFSFTALRVSTFPFALGSLVFCYLLVRRMGLSGTQAKLVTLLFGLCPIFLPVVVSYMTDVPGLFFMFASLYCYVRAADTSTRSEGYLWLLMGTLMAMVGGTGRQTVWLVPLTVLPSLAWLGRRSWFGAVSFGAWLATLAGVVEMISWLNRQSYVIFQPSVLKELPKLLSAPRLPLETIARLSLMVLLLCMPAVLPLAVQAAAQTMRGGRMRKIFVGFMLLGVFAAILIHPSLASIPWINSTLNWEGIGGSGPLPGRPVVLIRPVRAVVAIFVYVVGCLLVGEFANVRELARRAWRVVVDTGQEQFALATMTRLCLTYLVFVLLRETDFDIYDRYLLPMLPWAATVFLVWLGSGDQAEAVWKRVKPYSWAVLGVLAFYAVASSQDNWALARAKVEAAKELEMAGVPRTAIDAGFEYNVWTQLLMTGKVNSHWVVKPAGAYDPSKDLTPVVVPQYRLEYKLLPGMAPTSFGGVPYISFLPPFHRQVRIDRIVDSAESQALPPQNNP